ncbi:MAG: hypothetical protein WDO68_20160 [Gammaproteobacteria bacterium]
MWDAALAQEKLGYVYYTKVVIHNCVPYGSNEYGPAPYLLLFRNLTAANYQKLDTLPEVRIQTSAGARRAREGGAG